jgi:hypothetical protein
VKDKLKQRVKHQLKNLTIKDGIPDRIPLGKVDFEEIKRITKKGFLTSEMVFEIIHDFAFKELLSVRAYNEGNRNKKLIDYPQIDLENLSENISNYIINIPKNYFFIFKLPASSYKIPHIKLADNIELGVILDKKFQLLLEKSKQEPRDNVLSSLRGDSPSFKDNDIVLKVSAKGYVSNYSKIRISISDPLYTFKVILGIYIALGMIHIKRKKEYFPFPTEFGYYVYDSKSIERIRTIHESPDDTNYLNSIEFDETNFVLSERDKILAKKTTKFEDVNKILVNIFSNDWRVNKDIDPILKKQKDRIKNGAYWLYESLKTKQAHVKAIYLTTAFDSLVDTRVNEATRLHKAELIVSAISNNVIDFELDRDSIIKLYELRNKIVHGGMEVSSLNQFENKEKSNSDIISLCVVILLRYLSNRIYFVNKEALYWP